MKRITFLLLICIMLCGCNHTPTNASSQNAPGPIYSEEGLFPSEGALQAAELPFSEKTELYCIGTEPVIASVKNGTVFLTKFTGSSLRPACQTRTDLPIDFLYEEIQPGEYTISYFNRIHRQFVVLNSDLKEIRRISVPEICTGIPVINKSCTALFFCSEKAICVLNLENGIIRPLKEMDTCRICLIGTYQDDSLLLYRTAENDDNQAGIFLHINDGTTEASFSSMICSISKDDALLVSCRSQSTDSILWVTSAGEKKELVPEIGSRFLCFSGTTGVFFSNVSGCLSFFDLSSGQKTASILIGSAGVPNRGIADGQNRLFFLSVSDKTISLTCWNPSFTPLDNPTDYYLQDGLYPSSIAKCCADAESIGKKHGVHIRISDEAVSVQPMNCLLMPEYRTPLISQELVILDTILKSFPDVILSSVSCTKEPVTICLVQSIQEAKDPGSPDFRHGIRFYDDSRSYIALAIGSEFEQAFCHEFAHLMDTKVITSCNLYDRWEELNPEGFSYSYNCSTQLNPRNQKFLTGSRAFIDEHAMRSPSEDRARIMEYAMQTNSEAFFDSPVMQAKLRQLSIGIRKAFGLSKSPEVFQWEQYLWNSVSYKSI